MTLDLRIAPTSSSSFAATYSCPCGCAPSVVYERGAQAVTDACCCGNEFAVGPGASGRVRVGGGFHAEHADAASPWGDRVPVTWAIGPSTHGEPSHDDSSHGEGHRLHEDPATGPRDVADPKDPVCGMTVEPVAARAKGLHSAYGGREYLFCGKGCKLEFEDDPERYLDPTYVPSM